MKRKLIYLLAVAFTALSVQSYAQCSIYNWCTGADYSSGSNCHGFAVRYLIKGFNVGSPGCGSPTQSQHDMIRDCVGATSHTWTTVANTYFESGTSSDHTAVMYWVYLNNQWEATHTAVKIGGAYYMSKWENGGPVKKHLIHEVPSQYYQQGNGNYKYTYHKLKSQHYSPGSPTLYYNVPTLTLTACTSCSCDTSEGWFIANAASGYTNYNWSVSGAAIMYNAGSYIYINKPGGGSVGVTVQATPASCPPLGPNSKYQSFNFPYCSGGGYYYRLTTNSLKLEINDYSQLKADRVTPGADSETVNIQIHDLNGRLYLNQNIPLSNPYVELCDPLERGLYVVTETRTDGTVDSRKIKIDN